FFSRRRRHTILVSDWSSDVCSSDLAQSKGVTLIAYDRAIFKGNKTYYVSFDNEHVGELIGTGFKTCISDWKISKPQVYVLNGGRSEERRVGKEVGDRSAVDDCRKGA